MKDALTRKIEQGLAELIGGKSKKTKEEKDELRATILLAIKWQGVKARQDRGEWGSGFKNGQDTSEELDDDGDNDD